MIKMKRPPPRFCMIGVTRRANSQAPNTLVLKWESSLSLSISARRPARCVPALLTTMSMPPKILATPSTSAATSSGSRRSAAKPFATGELSVATAPASLSLSRPQTATVQPSAASFCATERPMPLVPPVMSAILPVSPRFMTLLGAPSAEHVAVIAAVDADRAAGDEAGAIGHQVSDKIGHLVRPAGAPERVGAGETGRSGGPVDASVAHFLVDQRGQQLRLDILRAHGVDADVVARHGIGD